MLAVKCFRHFHFGDRVSAGADSWNAAGIQQSGCLNTHTYASISLAFVPVADVARAFHELWSVHVHLNCMKCMTTSKNSICITGKPAQGRRRAMLPWYPPPLWYQYNTALQKSHRTNNESEGWHNSFSFSRRKEPPWPVFISIRATERARIHRDLRDRGSSRQTSEVCSQKEVDGIADKNRENSDRWVSNTCGRYSCNVNIS